jgi:hypothetical protein
MEDQEGGMTLLYYDFNGSKSSLSSRTQHAPANPHLQPTGKISISASNLAGTVAYKTEG